MADERDICGTTLGTEEELQAHVGAERGKEMQLRREALVGRKRSSSDGAAAVRFPEYE